MKDFIPLFPLKMVVFPNENLNLHIFEPRYKQLIRECEENKITFGIPSFIDKKIMPIGTEVKLLSIEKRHEGGELDIKTKAIGVFKIHEFYRTLPNKLYSGADIERLKEITTSDLVLSEKIFKNLKELFFILNIKKKLPDFNVQFQTFDIAHYVGFSLEQEYEFLSIPTENERQKYLQAHLKKLIPIVKEMEKLKQKAKLNGHFKNVIPPKL